MAEQKQIQKKILPALSLLTSEENLSFVIKLMLMSLVRTRLREFKIPTTHYEQLGNLPPLCKNIAGG